MDNKDQPAFPLTTNAAQDSEVRDGLTKREYFAGLAMQGILASMEETTPVVGALIAETSIKMADALLKQLSS